MAKNIIDSFLFLKSIMLESDVRPCADAPVGGRDVQKLSFLSAPFAPLQSSQIKKSTRHRNSAPRPAPPRLPHASLSIVPPADLSLHRHGVLPTTAHTVVACSLREVAPPDCCCRLHRGHRLRPITEGRTAARPLPFSFSTTAQPGSHYAVLHPPDCHVLLKAHVASVCFECPRCFKGILQMFHMDVAKVYRDTAYVAMVVYVCCKDLLPMFHLCF
jgi:hypothetical protein